MKSLQDLHSMANSALRELAHANLQVDVAKGILQQIAEEIGSRLVAQERQSILVQHQNKPVVQPDFYADGCPSRCHSFTFHDGTRFVPEEPGWYVTLVGVAVAPWTVANGVTNPVERSYFFGRSQHDFDTHENMYGIKLAHKNCARWGMRWWDGRRWSVAVFRWEIPSITTFNLFSVASKSFTAPNGDSVWWTYALPDGAKRP